MTSPTTHSPALLAIERALDLRVVAGQRRERLGVQPRRAERAAQPLQNAVAAAARAVWVLTALASTSAAAFAAS